MFYKYFLTGAVIFIASNSEGCKMVKDFSSANEVVKGKIQIKAIRQSFSR